MAKDLVEIAEDPAAAAAVQYLALIAPLANPPGPSAPPSAQALGFVTQALAIGVLHHATNNGMDIDLQRLISAAPGLSGSNIVGKTPSADLSTPAVNAIYRSVENGGRSDGSSVVPVTDVTDRSSVVSAVSVDLNNFMAFAFHPPYDRAEMFGPMRDGITRCNRALHEPDGYAA